MYESARVEGKTEEMRQLCCHPQISNYHCRAVGTKQRTLNEISKDLIEFKRKQIAETEEAIANYKESIPNLQRQLAALYAKETATSLNKMEHEKKRYTIKRYNHQDSDIPAF